MVLFGSDYSEQEWLTWACDTTADPTYSEQQRLIQQDNSSWKELQRCTEFNGQQEGQFLGWRGLNLSPESAWMNSVIHDTDMGSYKNLVRNDYAAEYESTHAGRLRGHGPSRPWPGLYTMPSSNSTSTTVSLDYIRSPQDFDVVPSTPPNAMEEDVKQRIDSSDQKRLDVNATCTPPTSQSPFEDLPTHRSKRKSSTKDEDQDTLHEIQKRTRTAQMADHSVCEKRYRTKLNVGLVALREIVPSLRVIPKQSEEYAYREGIEMVQRPLASTKSDKATIVSKAIEYIKYLENCNTHLSEEVATLKGRTSAIHELSRAAPNR